MSFSVSPPVVIEAQPDTTTCGPTCLHAVYRHFGDDIELTRVIDEIHRLDHGGTLDVFLANHALARGYRAVIHTWNLEVFDPTWFAGPKIDLCERLRRQAAFKRREKLSIATDGYLQYLESGGRIRFEDLNRALLRRLLSDGHPVLTGLSATYLYRGAREWGPEDADDDIRGEPVGHFVVLAGYRRETREVIVADPTSPNPQGRQVYSVHIDRVIGAILLGALTYDANLLVIRPCSN
ncbi:C39 family peptidase [Wenzhouxiangella sediminis]|uniref:Peptidase C39-like domain-containing protein n=1 Tax=Wenzhouxiangella sediminis TaxID=1792836 RepID=A0A3E1KCL6_9GAMM|nr:C39 family peptidase [Wenzhouxiangella sediminis]RFF32715.1 hypothetical protein DZC52_00925 [Wenzhouxiangella sediminis]